MAHAQYETRTRTVEEKFVVLTLTGDEARTLRSVLDGYSGPNSVAIYRALVRPTAARTATDEAGDTFEYEGITYEIGAIYRDADGDHFDFKAELSAPGTPDRNADGTPIGRFRGQRVGREPNNWNWSLREVVECHGPLTKVTA
ncbi:phiSA1p31-related protein [Streptomyces sp. NPDC056230]|uniref:phiSA1p31-related protein n=1 Tax=Streptomyces sp. NPDC056230 TaxID=3345754 RepID=UPI0035E0BC68